MPVIFNKCYAIFSKMPSSIFLLSSFNQKHWFLLQDCGLNSKTVKKRLDGSGTEKSVPIPSFFWSVSFHYRTIQRFQKVSLEYRSASFLTGPDQRFKWNYTELFPGYRKTGVLNGTRFCLTSMGSVSNLAHAWDKHSSLLQKSINYGCKKFNSTGPWWTVSQNQS